MSNWIKIEDAGANACVWIKRSEIVSIGITETQSGPVGFIALKNGSIYRVSSAAIEMILREECTDEID